MTNNFNINLYKKSQQNSNSAKTPHEIVRFLMENLLNLRQALRANPPKHVRNKSKFENFEKKSV